jgi:hypothetical protein
MLSLAVAPPKPGLAVSIFQNWVEVMHERNAHNFPLDLASGDVLPVALTAPAVNG